MDEAAYYHRRAEQARVLAERAKDIWVRRIHLDLARRYAELERAAMPPSQPSA